MIELPKPTIVAEGFTLPECPRWHGEALYFVDIMKGRIFRLEGDGRPALLYQDPSDFIGGIGFSPEGALIAVASKQRQLLRIGPDGAQPYADLSRVCDFVLNDMIVTGRHFYVSQPGYDIWSAHARTMPAPTDLLHAAKDEEAIKVASEMASPNGMAVGPDGKTLFVAECTAMRISCFDLDPDTGSLTNRRIFGVLPDGGIPDGICLDDSGSVWAAVPVAATATSFGAGLGVIRLEAGGVATHVVPIEKGRRALACAFGGADRATLYICTVPDFANAASLAEGQGRLEAVRLDFRGAGLP